MLCVFSSLNDLTDCFSAVETNKQDREMLSFRAKRSNNQTIYGVICTNSATPLSKTLSLNLGVCSLPSEEEDENDDWSSSFDSISAQLSSNNKSLVVQNNKFVLDSIIWPKLGCEKEEHGGIRHGEWTVDEIKSLHDALSALNLDGDDEEGGGEGEGYDEGEENNNNNGEGGEEGSEEWEMVMPPPPPTESPRRSPKHINNSIINSNNQQTGGQQVGTVRNYREALLSAAKQSEVLISPERKRRAFAEKQEQLRHKVWTAPRIEVGKITTHGHELKNRLYVHQLKEKGIEEPSNIQFEEDEDIGGSFFQSTEYNKGSVSLTRYNNATKLRPAMLEKKLARIAAKPLRDKDGKVIQPGAGGDSDSDE